LIGENRKRCFKGGGTEFDAVDGSSTGTRVPWMWAPLRLPRFGGANHADDHDNRSGMKGMVKGGAVTVSLAVIAAFLITAARSFGP
jgi:hypothetical protein